MTGHLDRYGEPIEDDDAPSVPPNETGEAGVRTAERTPTGITRSEIHRDRCAELRAIIRAAKARREAQP
jgi:hypothetical protein